MAETHESQDTQHIAGPKNAIFREGDLVMLVDRKRRRYLQRLTDSGSFQTHLGFVPHADIIGQSVGSRVFVGGHRYLALRPTLAEYTVESRRLTQIIYPKDVGAILVAADIFPGARVLEAGLGSGSLSMSLLRAIGPDGELFSYEVREGSIAGAQENIRVAMGETPNHTVRCHDLYRGIPDAELDRVVLDVPEPWRAVEHAAKALVPGGIFLAYLPTVLQVHRLVDALNREPEFDMVDSFEVLHRPWHVTRRSVRPVHRMVAHTAFLTTARKCAPGKLLRLDDQGGPWYPEDTESPEPFGAE